MQTRTLAGKRLEVDEARGRALSAQGGAGLAGQFPCAAEQPVQQKGALDVMVQLVLGGETDASEHLLAVFRRGQRGLTRRGLGQQRGEIAGAGAQHRLGTLDRDACFGQPVPDGLE